MPARSTRQAARERILQAFRASLDRMIPADEAKPMKGSLFIDFEDQAQALARDVLPIVMEERVALEAVAQVESPGCCPHCGSSRVYLKKETRQVERRSPHGAVVIPTQQARCRACGESFSPSGS